jgi:hypothetical protein
MEETNSQGEGRCEARFQEVVLISLLPRCVPEKGASGGFLGISGVTLSRLRRHSDLFPACNSVTL